MTLEVSPPRDLAEASAFYRIAAESLLGPVARSDDWRDMEGVENTRVARVDGVLAGGLSVQRMGQWFGGKSVPCGVVRAVAVAPEHRGTRVADAFLRAALLELRDAGIPVSMLFPATQIIYRRIGFEQAGAWVDWTAPLTDFSTRERDLPVTRVAVDDPAIKPLYDAFAERSTGLLDRSPWMWRRNLTPFVPLELSAYLLGPKGAPEGYLLVHSEKQEGTRFAALRVRDRAFLTARAVSRAQSFLAEHRSMYDSARICGGLIEPLFVRLPNQLQSIARREDWMLRLVDVAGALRARGYPDGVDAEVHLLVRDDVLPPAEQRLVLRIRDGAAEIDEGGTGAVDVDVRGLAALYSGFMSPSEIAALGYLRGDERAASALSAAFAGPASWMNEIV